MLEGVRQAFQALDELSGVATGRRGRPGRRAEPDADPGPEVHVVDGGLDDDAEPPEDRDPPDLRLAPEPDETDESLEDHLLAGAGPLGASGRGRERDVRVTVHRLGPGDTVRRATPVPDVRRRGAVLVGAGEGQTLYRGRTARLYRVSCTEGALRVEVDGVPTETLRPGQAVDIEASFLRVHGEGAKAAGIYALVKQP